LSRLVDASPPARAHIAALSKIGYDFNTAVSDIIDNSITANAKNINIEFYITNDDAIFVIADDGHGMSEADLISNMCIGCRDPAVDRCAGDLGRFGAGLKTASFSQSRVLSVISKSENSSVSAAVWDKDVVEVQGWLLQVLEPSEIDGIIPKGIILSKSGTIVRWDNIAVIQELLHSPDKQLQIDKLCGALHSHIGLYFHRFLSGKDAIDIKINNRSVVAIDPFMRSIKGAEELASTSLRGDKGKVTITAYRLPFFTNMSRAQLDGYGGEAAIRQGQGLYIYRERRLIIAGGWMGMTKHSGLSGLARVQVDIPATLDNEWSTDVKKSSLQIPPKVKEQIRRLISKPVASSKGAYTYRGKQEVANTFWLINNDERNNFITYEIDPQNPSLKKIADRLSSNEKRELIQYLTSLAVAIPINHIYASMGSSPKSISQDGLADEDRIKALIESLNNDE
jgi:hypothetical protein